MLAPSPPPMPPSVMPCTRRRPLTAGATLGVVRELMMGGRCLTTREVHRAWKRQCQPPLRVVLSIQRERKEVHALCCAVATRLLQRYYRRLLIFLKLHRLHRKWSTFLLSQSMATWVSATRRGKALALSAHLLQCAEKVFAAETRMACDTVALFTEACADMALEVQREVTSRRVLSSLLPT
eukprot:Sspe_Gene.68280::Locus_40284_Transcript_1_1_Confidence_1.000_Length_1175::g.68280::m.68280